MLKSLKTCLLAAFGGAVRGSESTYSPPAQLLELADELSIQFDVPWEEALPYYKTTNKLVFQLLTTHRTPVTENGFA